MKKAMIPVTYKPLFLLRYVSARTVSIRSTKYTIKVNAVTIAPNAKPRIKEISVSLMSQHRDQCGNASQLATRQLNLQNEK